LRQWDFPNLAQVQVGAAHACALAGGRVACVGSNSSGQLGVEHIEASDVPEVVPGVPPVRQIAVGYDHSCGLDTTGSVWCWGRDDAPGTESESSHRSPHRIPELTARAVLAHGHLTCAVTTAGSVRCWGLPELRQPSLAFPKAEEFFLTGGLFCALAGGTRDCTAVLGPQALGQWASSLLGTAPAKQQLVVGKSHACELSQSGEVTCWGDNRWAQLGHPPQARLATSAENPQAIKLDHAQQLAVHGNATCALEAAGTVACWGAISPDFRRYYPTPRRVALAVPVQELAAGADQSCARSEGGWYCWGRSLAEGATTGESAAGEDAPPTAHRYGPRLEPTLTGLSELVVGGGFACGLAGGRVKCAGPAEPASDAELTADVSVELGFGVPRPVAGGGSRAVTPASRLVVDGEKQCALDQAAEVRCAAPGATALGEPVLSDVRQLVGGSCHLCALTGKGEVYCWGCNHAGQVGAGIPRYSAVPQRLPEAPHAHGESP